MFSKINKFQNYIFDLDGTLVDSSEEVMYCLGSACANLGVDMNLAKFNTDVIGPPLEDIFRIIIIDNKNEALIERLMAEFKSIYDFDADDESPMYQNTYDWLISLKNAGKRLFLATNKFSIPTFRLLKKFKLNLFEDVYTIDKHNNAEISKQQMIQEIVANYGLIESETVMVGDTVGDIKAANASGVKGIGVLWGYGKNKTPLREISDFVINIEDIKL